MMNSENVPPDALPVNSMGASPANDIDAFGPDDLAAWQRAWCVLPVVHQRRLAALAQALLTVAAAPRRRRSSVRAPAPDVTLRPEAVAQARALLRRHAGGAQ
jgi:hypothetical protein